MAYTTLSDFASNTTLTAGTYWMPYDINCNSYTLTFNCVDGPIVIKRAGDYSFAFSGAVTTTNSTTTNKVYWTVKDDDTIGETISGSTGTPVKYGLVFNSIGGGIGVNVNFTAINWEFRYVNNTQFIYLRHTSGTTKIFQYITWKYCDFSSVEILRSYVYNYGAATAQYFMFDSTNTMTGNADLFGNVEGTWGDTNGQTSYVDHIFVENANTSSYVIKAFLGAQGQDSYIRIKNAGNAGVADMNVTAHTISYCCASIRHGGYTTATHTYKDCLFDSDLTGYAYAIRRPDQGSHTGQYHFEIKNCVFKGFTSVFYNEEYGGDCVTYINATNCCFVNNTKLLQKDDLGHQTANYCGYYNNGETYWSRGANDFTADPSFGNYDGTIDSTFNQYGPQNGYVTTAAAYQNTGSDTYDNLSIDETVFSPDGTQRSGTDIVNPGIYYKFTKFKETVFNLFFILGINF